MSTLVVTLASFENLPFKPIKQDAVGAYIWASLYYAYVKPFMSTVVQSKLFLRSVS